MAESFSKEKGVEVNQGSEPVPFELFYFDSELSHLEADERVDVIERFLRNGGVWNLVDYLDKSNFIKSGLDVESAERSAEKGEFSQVPEYVVKVFARRKIAGRFFEEIARSSLETTLSRNWIILSPEETEVMIHEIEGDESFSTMPDGIIFKVENGKSEMIGVAEYKLRSSLAQGRNRRQYENLQCLVNDIGPELTSDRKGRVKVALGEAGHKVGKVTRGVPNLKVYYVVPRGGKRTLGLSDDETTEVVESPLSRKGMARFMGAFLLDYVKYRQGVD